MAAYDAICFDLDMTLCESTQNSAHLLESTFDGTDCEQFCTPAELRAAVSDLSSTETAREFYDALFTEVAQRADVDPSVAPTLASEYLERQDPTAVQFRPGAKAALDHAIDRGQVGLITNGGRTMQTRKLRSLGIEDAFDVRVFTEPSAGISPKPSVAPFERALGELDVAPDAAIHVGDSLHADIAGANAMGLDSAWLDPGRDTSPNDHEPTYELASLESLATIV
ncbi:HAD family hydrolase [Natrinema halophilum]|uniref:HAD family hydrolase n=1 Tax=Natrinema halophilum TaxID=1699371 RepID=A0A7D5HAL9_9EURY|nr:HAD family hydrolase [Natrinema halophilum]QLG50855.1 HAD family hydrolase [Natrinema halophilum]